MGCGEGLRVDDLGSDLRRIAEHGEERISPQYLVDLAEISLDQPIESLSITYAASASRSPSANRPAAS